MKTEPSFQLSAQELQSPLWLKLTEHYSKRLASLRARNDESKPLEQTEKLRGRIHEIKFLLALNDPAPAIVANDD